jgi:hypothetical protein
MSRAVRIQSSIFAFVFALTGYSVAEAEQGQIVTKHFEIAYEDVSEDSARIVSVVAEKAVDDVTRYLGIDYSGRISLTINKGIKRPRSRPKSLGGKDLMEIPANRIEPPPPPDKGTGPSGGARRQKGGPTLWHGVTNVVAWSGHPEREWGRFLSEALGVYMQDKFGGKRAMADLENQFGSKDPRRWRQVWYPTFGAPLHEAPVKILRRLKKLGVSELLPMETAKEVVNDPKSTPKRLLAWAQAGSFVRYLIEENPRTRGIERYLKWHGGSSFEEAYGVPMEQIEAEWRNFVGQLAG